MKLRQDFYDRLYGWTKSLFKAGLSVKLYKDGYQGYPRIVAEYDGNFCTLVFGDIQGKCTFAIVHDFHRVSSTEQFSYELFMDVSDNCYYWLSNVYCKKVDSFIELLCNTVMFDRL